jgi:alpha-beta hydrolase superfamily lysophospholipase
MNTSRPLSRAGSREPAPPAATRAALLALAWSLMLVGCMPPSWAARAMLYPGRRPPKESPRRPVQTVDLEGAGVQLKGWRFAAEGPVKRGTVVYLHGMGDSRRSSLYIADHFVPAGYDVLAYDSRGHGESGGEACTFGVYEKQDLARVLSGIVARPIVLLGSSLGAAVALQAAAQSSDVAAVISVSVFSDLRRVARERAPFFASEGNIVDALAIAEREGHFRVADASPVTAAPLIKAPVLLIHGAEDDETRPVHSQRVFQALRAPKQLILVPGAGHNGVVTREVWSQIDDWLRRSLPAG